MALDYGVGDVIVYRPFGGGRRRVVVTNREADIKNGRAGFDGQMVTEDESGRLIPDLSFNGFDGNVWGYDDQIIEVE